MGEQQNNEGISRRNIVKGAAWSVPVIAMAVSTPLASASPTEDPGVTITPGNGPWSDAGRYDGYIAEGIVITVADENGVPLPDVQVVLSTNADRNNFWFVQDPSLSATLAQRRSNQLSTITLTTDAQGRIHLNGVDEQGRAIGHLRKGSDGESGGATITATYEGYTASINVLNSSSAGGTNPGIEPGSVQ